MEDIVSSWLLEILRLPARASVGFVTGAHMANFTCLAAARHEVLRRVGWNVEQHGRQGAPRVTLVAGDHAHVSVIGALALAVPVAAVNWERYHTRAPRSLL